MNQTSRTILWAKFHHRHARHLSAREQQSNRPSCFFQDFLGTLHSLKLKLINGFIGESKRDTMVYVIEYGGWWLFQNFPRCVYCGYASGKHRSFKPCLVPSSPQQTAPGTTWGTQKWSNPSGGGIFVYYLQWLYTYIYIYVHSKSFPVAFCRALLSHEMVVIMPTTEWMSIPDNLFSGSILETTKKKRFNFHYHYCENTFVVSQLVGRNHGSNNAGVCFKHIRKSMNQLGTVISYMGGIYTYVLVAHRCTYTHIYIFKVDTQ